MEKRSAQVIWYNQVAGYGFLAVDGYPHDLFLHNSEVRKANITPDELQKGVKVKCIIGTDKRSRLNATELELDS